MLIIRVTEDEQIELVVPPSSEPTIIKLLPHEIDLRKLCFDMPRAVGLTRKPLRRQIVPARKAR